MLRTLIFTVLTGAVVALVGGHNAKILAYECGCAAGSSDAGYWGEIADGGCASCTGCGGCEACGSGCCGTSDCDMCGGRVGRLARCNYGHGCDLLGRFGAGCGCDSCGDCGGCGLFGCGLFGLGGCSTCSGPGAGDPTGATVRYCGMPSPPYPVPHPVPAYVGYTYFTYPPMMPHHSLPHYRGTYSYRHAPGLSRTTVHWRAPTLINTAARIHHIFELPR